MTARNRRARLATWVLPVAGVLSACGGPSLSPSPVPSAAPTPATVAPAELALGCIGITQAECRFVAERVVTRVAGDRGAPFSVLIELYGCGEVACPESLDAREGRATVEWADPANPVTLELRGPATEPRIAPMDFAWSGLQQPASERVTGAGPFPFTLGHCGLTWQVDFDGSFWVPIGHIDGDAPGLINAEEGVIRLLAPNLAEYQGSEWSAQLARFPGPKHVWLCM